MASGKTRGDLDVDLKLNLALVRLLEIVGEAARAERLLTNACNIHKYPWNQIVGLRNRLIHGYDSVDFDILWQIVHYDLPALIVALEQIVPSESGA